MELRSGYKQTELGMIPEDWDVLPLKSIGRPVRGGSPRPAGDPRYFDGSYIPWLTVAALTNIPGSQLVVSETASCLTEEGADLSRTLHPGTLIIANSGATLGVAKILGVKCCANDGIAALLDIKKQFSPEYLAYVINTKTEYLREVVATGNGQPNLNTGLIGDFVVQVPNTRKEQEAISAALQDADALIEALEQLLAKKRQIKQGAMQELLTGKKRLAGFECDWSTKRLGDLGIWKGGMTPSMSNPEYWTPGTLPWISSGDVKSPRLTSTVHSVSQNAVAKGATTVIPERSLVVVFRSGILRRYLPVSLTLVPMAINQDVKALIADGCVRPDYLLHLLIYKGGDILSQCLKSGTTVESLEFGWFKDFEISLPSIQEQNAISELLNDLEGDISVMNAKLAKARELKQGMMQELLTGRIRLV